MESNPTEPIKSRHIFDLSLKEKRAFLNSFDVVFSDIDGVLWILKDNIKGCTNGFNALKKAGKNVTFITNNSVLPIERYDANFKKIGLSVDVNTIVHPAKTVAKYLKNTGFNGLIYAIATDSFKNVLRKEGFQIMDIPNKILEESFSDLWINVYDKQLVQAVIIDVDFNLSAAKMIRAYLYLKNPDCILITGATDDLLPVTRDINIIGPGPYGKILTELSGRKPIQLGKPGKDLCSILLEEFQIPDSRRVLMIGDMLKQDVGFGKICNFQTLLVFTGGTSFDDLQKETDPSLIPDYHADSVADFVRFMEDVADVEVY